MPQIMKLLFLFLLFGNLSEAEENRLTIERLFESPELEGQVPRSLTFSDNGQRLMFLAPKLENHEILDLWEYDLQTGHPKLLIDSKSLGLSNLTEEQKARKERMRIDHSGITEFVLSNDGEQILIPSNGKLFYYTPGKMQQLSMKSGAAIDLKFSPKNRFISYVRNQNLYIRKPDGKNEFAITKEGRKAISYGTAEFVAQEEMDRFTGYWWSKDESYLALTRVDENPVKIVSRFEVGADSVKTHQERYPEAGSSNARVTLGIVKVSEVLRGQTKIDWVPMHESDDIYLARVYWSPNQKLIFQVETRDQKNLIVYEYDPRTKHKTELFRETDSHWINLHDDLTFLKKSKNFIWTSERSGFRHIYLYEAESKSLKGLTQGSWQVDAIEGIDEDKGWIYFTGTLKSPLEKHLYRVSYREPEIPTLITKEDGWHIITMNKSATVFLDRFSTPISPPRVLLKKASGEEIADISKNDLREGHPLYPFLNSLVTPEFGSFTGPSGDLIYYSLLKPKGFKFTQKYPLVVMGYGGPTVQVVTNKWNGLWKQILVDHGFVVASIDNRGTPRRGRSFANAIFHKMGQVELEDQVAGIKQLISLGFIDEARVGFYGWSYGGYLSLMLASKAPKVFRANLAVAPVTDFALYDTHYTERYLGKPQEEPTVYRQANVLDYTPSIKGRLMILHGMADDNVLFTNSTLLFKKLQEDGVLFESVTYPGAKHGLSGKTTQTHVLKTIVDFFERTLKP